MAKLDLYTQYYYSSDNYEDESDNYYNDGSDEELLIHAFETLCEKSLTPGKDCYEEYLNSVQKIKMYRSKMLNGEGFGSGKGNFYRTG